MQQGGDCSDLPQTPASSASMGLWLSEETCMSSFMIPCETYRLGSAWLPGPHRLYPSTPWILCHSSVTTHLTESTASAPQTLRPVDRRRGLPLCWWPRKMNSFYGQNPCSSPACQPACMCRAQLATSKHAPRSSNSHSMARQHGTAPK